MNENSETRFKTNHNTIDAILIQWHANKWQGILQLSQDWGAESKK